MNIRLHHIFFICVLQTVLFIGSAGADEQKGKLCGNQVLSRLFPTPKHPWQGSFKGSGSMPEVGDEQGFWTYDLSVMPPQNMQIDSTCRGVGDQVAIWVADDEWGSEVDQDDIDIILETLESSSPSYPDQGVVENNIILFGEPPVVAQGDPLLTLLIYDIPGYNGYTFDGFFRHEDLAPNNPQCAMNPMLYCSNELGMIHVKAQNISSDYMLGVIAHEFEHLIHFGQDLEEESWVDESLAELAMIYSGYDDPSHVSAFTRDPSMPLIIPPPVHYGSCLFFGTYLHQRLGSEGITALIADTAHGIEGIENHIDVNFDLFFGQWVAANFADEPTFADGEFGYDLMDYPAFYVDNFGSSLDREATISASSALYLETDKALEDNEALSIVFDSMGTSCVAHIVTDEGVFLLGSEAVELPRDENGVIAIGNPSDDSATVGIVLEIVSVTSAGDPEPESDPEPTPDVQEDTSSSNAEDSDAAVETDEELQINPKKEDDGCSVTGTRSTPSSILVMLLALVLLWRGRRIRK